MSNDQIINLWQTGITHKLLNRAIKASQQLGEPLPIEAITDGFSMMRYIYRTSQSINGVATSTNRPSFKEKALLYKWAKQIGLSESDIPQRLLSNKDEARIAINLLRHLAKSRLIKKYGFPKNLTIR